MNSWASEPRPRTRREHRARLPAALLALVLVLAACSGAGSGGDESPASGGTVEVAPAGGGDGVGEGPVQDIWVYERVQTVDSGGALVDVTHDLVDGLDGDEAAAVELVDGVTFTPVPALDARIRDDENGFREDLDVVAGIVESREGRALQVVATPTGEKSVEADDLIVLDLAHLGLPDGAPLVLDFAFGQGIPSVDEPAGTDGLELLRARLAEERFHWYAVDDETGVGLMRVLGSVPGDGPGPEQGTALRGSFDAVRAIGPRTTTSPVGAARPGLGGGGIPAKARPVTDSLNKLGNCKGSAIKCLSKYFKDQEKGSRKVMEDLFDDNTPGPRSKPCTGCGGNGGDPHIHTFDGLRYDLQLVGEFVLARTDELEVQVRQEPLGTTNVSVITAVAVRFGDHRLTVRDDREPAILLDGEPFTREAAEARVTLGGATVQLVTSDLVVTAANGADVRLRHALSGASDVLVSPGPDGSHVAEWSGLLGNDDDSVGDDLTTRDGDALTVDPDTRVAEQPGIGPLHDTFGKSWRITDQESLFDYRDGESTATFTDLDFPAESIGLDDLPDADVAVARTLCSAAGISDDFWFDACVLDYVLTKDISFITRAQTMVATVSPPLAGWTEQISGDRTGPVVLDRSSGNILAPSGSDEGGELTALDVESGEVAWRIDTAGTGCVGVVAEGQVVVPVPGDDGLLELSVRDPATGEEREAAPTALRTCEAMVVHEDTVVVLSRNTLLGIDVVRPEVAFELELGKLVSSPVVSGDGQVWVLRKNSGQMEAVRIDPTEGTPTTVPVPVASLFGNIAATPDGVLLGFRGEHRGTGGLLRLDRNGVVWQTDLPQSLEGVERTHLPSGPISVSGDRAATYLGETIVLFDLADGSPSGRAEASRVSNNHGALLLADPRTVVVGPFGGDAWVEAWQPGASTPLWSAQVPGERIHDAKTFGPVTAAGQVVVTATSEGGYVVEKVGPGS